MSYPYFFIKTENVDGSRISVKGNDFNHLANVLRVKKGDVIDLSDSHKFRYKAEVVKIDRAEALLSVKEKYEIFKPFPRIILFQCILKKNAMEIAIQKTAEIGISSIVPIFSRRVIIDKKRLDNKIGRWGVIAMQASKQCKRDFICKVESPIDIFSINISKFDIFYLPYERIEKKKSEGIDILGRLSDYFKKITSSKVGSDSGGSDSSNRHITGSIGYIIGPEGGFEEEEVNFLKRNKAAVVYLGKNILRSETAAIYFLSVLDYSLKRYKRY